MRWKRGGSLAVGVVALFLGCRGRAPARDAVVLRVSGSVLGEEGAVLRRQLERWSALRTGVRAEVQATPDAADQRHQLYVQWLNAHAARPDVLQLDVVWTPEFAAAGWILPLDELQPPVDSFFPATMRAARWHGRTYALPWFVDVGMLYWRTDLLSRPPVTFDELTADAAAGMRTGVEYGLVWQGARYEGLTATFLEQLRGFGGRIMDGDGRVVVDSDAGVRALTYMVDSVWRRHIVPPAALAWHEEETRFAFQNGQAVFMRNWPYAYPLMQDSAASRVAGRFAVAPMPAVAGSRPAATLGGAQLAINARSAHPREAYALITYLTAPAQMLERSRAIGQYPTRPALYATPDLAAALPIPPEQALEVIRNAIPRPVTPVYTELSEVLQVWLHRALTRQAPPAEALRSAAEQMRALLRRVHLAPTPATP